MISNVLTSILKYVVELKTLAGREFGGAKRVVMREGPR